jgi:methylated-DNA-protein-cysteine methyltransferase-like protein
MTNKLRVLDIVSTLQYGQLTTYGSIAKRLEMGPREVGWIMSGLNETEQSNYPWQRVVAKNGVISSLKLGARGMLQIEILKKEGFKIDKDQVVDFVDVLDENSISLF